MDFKTVEFNGSMMDFVYHNNHLERIMLTDKTPMYYDRVFVRLDSDCWEYWKDQDGKLTADIEKEKFLFKFCSKVYRNDCFLVRVTDYVYRAWKPYQAIQYLIKKGLTTRQALMLYNYLNGLCSSNPQEFSYEWFIEAKQKAEASEVVSPA